MAPILQEQHELMQDEFAQPESPQQQPYPAVYIHPNLAAAHSGIDPAIITAIDTECACKQDKWLEATYRAKWYDLKVHRSWEEQEGYIADSKGSEDREIEGTSRGESAEWNQPNQDNNDTEQVPNPPALNHQHHTLDACKVLYKPL